ncbi:MAG: glutamate-1-semialdehyde 2,1-aminomutase [Longimicrobiales bacterium]
MSTITASESSRLFQRARQLIPGGVNSPVRAFGKVGAEPFFVDHAAGARIFDIDRRGYLDYVMSWGALMLGHAHPSIVRALSDAVGRGTSYGAPSGAEVELAQLVVELVPSVEMVRFVNSGTEATMSALRLARAATGRDVVVKFDGCYHGHADYFLVKAGSGVATLGLPDSPGVPRAAAELTRTVPFNDADALRALFEAEGERIACVIIEPVAGNSGFIPPVAGFLESVRAITRQYGALLIFDEVMTGFRVGPGGAQQRFAIEPDLTTLGKVIGGGLPVGAYGGRRDLMERVAPSGPVYQAGTLSGNPLAMAAGIAQLLTLRESAPHAELEERALRLVNGVVDAAHELGLPAWGGALGAMFGWHFVDGPVRTFEDAQRVDGEFFARFYRACLERGLFLPASPYEAMFLSTAHTDADVDQTIEQITVAMQEARQ